MEQAASREAADDPSIALLIASRCGLAPGERADSAAIVQGRLTARRKHGSTLVFLDLMCGEHKMQLVVECDGSEGGHHLAPLGSLVRAAGAPGRTMRGELSLFCRPAAVELLQLASVPVAGPQQRPNAPAPRFHVTPNNVRWGRPLGLLGLGACNTLSWRGGAARPALSLTLPVDPPLTPTATRTPAPTLSPSPDQAPRCRHRRPARAAAGCSPPPTTPPSRSRGSSARCVPPGANPNPKPNPNPNPSPNPNQQAALRAAG